VLAVMGFMVLFGKISSNYIKLGQLNKEIESVKQEITQLDAESAEIKEILDEEDHNDYFEKIAREKYGYCKPGEKVYYNSSFGE
jgi:cell division protein FtsB